MSTFMNAFFVLLLVVSYFVAPAALIWGWIRWVNHAKIKTLSSTLSFIGFNLGTASGILAVAGILFAQSGGTQVERQFVRWFLVPGALLSLLGLVFAISGVRRKNPLRWLAPVGTMATLAFWFLSICYLD